MMEFIIWLILIGALLKGARQIWHYFMDWSGAGWTLTFIFKEPSTLSTAWYILLITYLIIIQFIL